MDNVKGILKYSTPFEFFLRSKSVWGIWRRSASTRHKCITPIFVSVILGLRTERYLLLSKTSGASPSLQNKREERNIKFLGHLTLAFLENCSLMGSFSESDEDWPS
jgi:hypothetical protein